MCGVDIVQGEASEEADLHGYCRKSASFGCPLERMSTPHTFALGYGVRGYE